MTNNRRSQIYWEIQEFESRVLGFRSAKLVVDVSVGALDFNKTSPYVLENMRSNGVQFVSCRLRSDQEEHAYALKKNGFIKADSIISFERPINPVPIVDNRNRIMLANSSNLEACTRIARRSFTFERFHNDPEISEEQANNLKDRWIENDLSGRADACFVSVEKNNEITGFMACLDNAETVVIDLIAVDQNQRGRGIGSSLIAFAIDHYKKDTLIKKMVVGTQELNLPSISLYKKMGFFSVAVFETFHFHMMWNSPGA